MTAAAPTTAWLVAALASADRVLLLGAGWEDVAAALEHQGVDVAVGDPGDDLQAGDGTVAVGAALATPGALEAAAAAGTDLVVTRLDLSTPADLASLAGPWPLAARAEASIDTTWVAAWEPTETPGPDLAGRLVTAVHTAALGLRALADAAVASRESSARAAGVATRRQASAEARARTTATVTDRWVASQDVLVHSLLQRIDQPPAASSPSGAGLRSLFSRRPDPDATSGPAARRTRSPSGWRVAAVAGPASDWLRGWVDALEVAPDDAGRGDLVERVGGHLDVLVIGRVDAPDRQAVVRLVDEARQAGAFVVGVADAGMPWAGFADLCDLLVSDAPDPSIPRTLAAPQPVDPAVVNPRVGFRWRGEDLVTVCTGTGIDADEVQAAAAALGGRSELVGAGTDDPLPDALHARARRLARVLGVLDVPEAHATVGEHARTLVGLTAAGIPVIAPTLPDPVRRLLGPVLADALADARLADLDDPTTRERTSVRQRRAALWTHTHEARWRRIGRALDLAVPPRPSVSAVVVTNRPSDLAHCAEQLARQTHRPLEVVLGLHGTAFRREQVDAFVERVGLPVTGVAIDGHRTLGEGLNLACQAASGDILTKWDDDDHYGPDHVVDLVQALDYSGATIVGKGAEFVHLGQLDVTIRRFVGRAESGSRSLAGGTLALRREHLAEAGWWRRIPRSVDQRLLDDVERAGGRIHRTHGFGFVLERRSSGHTWSVDVDYFLRQSEGQWRGLAREVADLDDSVLARGPGRA